jgi:hypothetical protein
VRMHPSGSLSPLRHAQDGASRPPLRDHEDRDCGYPSLSREEQDKATPVRIWGRFGVEQES